VVDLSPLKGSAKLDLAEKGIPWTTLTYLDELAESQNALRVVLRLGTVRRNTYNRLFPC
jgi:hypothetical protein